MKNSIKKLSTKETEVIRKRLNKVLQSTLQDRKIPTYWYPLFEVKKYVSVLAFHSEFFDDDNRMQILSSIFQNRGIDKVIRLPEFNNANIINDFINSYLLKEDEYGFELPYMSECYLFDKNKDWLIYTSHEHTITFAGKWLVNEIKAAMPDYRDGIWCRHIHDNRHNFIYRNIHSSNIDMIESTPKIRKMFSSVKYLEQQRNNLFVNHDEYWLEITLLKTKDFLNISSRECDDKETNYIHIVTKDNLSYANVIEEMLLGIAFELGWKFN